MGFLADLYKTFVLDEDVKKYRKQYQSTSTGAVVPVEEDTPKKQDNEDSGSGGASSEGGDSYADTDTVNNPLLIRNTTVNTSSADDPAAGLEAYGDELAAQRKEDALQMLWDMAGVDNIWGKEEQPKVATAAETLHPWELDDAADGTAASAAEQEAADYQRLGSGALVDPADNSGFNPVDWLQSKWQEGQQQMESGTGAIYQPQDFGTVYRTPSGGVVTGNVDFPDWVDEDGVFTTLPTYGEVLQYYSGMNKEGGASTENYGDDSYLGRSLNQILLGNYTDNVTALGTAAQMAAGFFDADLPMDIRDLTYDITHWQTTPEHIGQTVLDAVGLIPVIGMVKYADELGTLAKNADKAADVANGADEADKGAGETLKISDEQFGKKVGKHAEDFGFDVSNHQDRNFIWNRTNDIYCNPTEIRKGVFRGQGEVLPNGANATGKVKFYIQGNDVVMTDMNGNFITIMKDGINNIYVKKATKIWP